MYNRLKIATLLFVCIGHSWAFTLHRMTSFTNVLQRSSRYHSDGNLGIQSPSSVLRSQPDPQIVALVAGQENYGLAIVAVGEALWSFLEAPSLEHSKILVPAALSAIILTTVSGPMITSGNLESAGVGLGIATAASFALSFSYIARLTRFSPSKKEIIFLGLLFSVAGIFSFGQNLIVDGFVNLPSISLPSIFPENEFDLPESAYMIN